jgi:sulfoxide reductase catalytic subunit YedY
MNGQPLPIAHGAPLRLRVETQLGSMMVKYIKRIKFIADYRNMGQGQGGRREDHQFYSPEAGISTRMFPPAIVSMALSN